MLEINEGRKKYVYGAGFAGKTLAGYLMFCQHQAVEALVVSNGHKELDEYKFPIKISDKSIPILEYGELGDDSVSSDFYVTLDIGKEEVIQMIQNSGLGGVIDATPYLAEIIEEYNQVVCRSYGIDINNSPILFKNVKSLNFLDNFKFRKTFWGTYGDEILPSVYHENALAIDGPYEIEDYNVTVKQGDVIFDVGANLGLFSCYAADKGCRVYAFDPDENCVEVLNEQRKIYSAITVAPVGLSNETGVKEFFESEDCALSSMSRISSGRSIKKVVHIKTLDRYVEENHIDRVDFIKADIEGEERNMLYGATHVLKSMAPKLSICTYHYPEDPELLENIIKIANPNYVVNHAWRKLYAYVPRNDGK